MFEFIVGYLLGASKDVTVELSWKSIGIFLLVLMTISGVGWLVIAGLEPDREVEQCGGNAVMAFHCNLIANATKFGVLSLGTVAVVALVWIAVITMTKK